MNIIHESILANLHLNAVLPLMEEIAEFDCEAQEIIKNWNCSIQFHILGQSGVNLIFSDSRIKVQRGTRLLPSVALLFPSPTSLNKMFKGGFVLPIIWKGFWHIVIIKNFINLTKRLEYYLRPNEALLKDKKNFKFIVKLMLYTAVYGIKEVGEKDPSLKNLVEHTAQGTLEIKILPDGPAAHITLKDGEFYPAKGTAQNPDIIMEFRNHQVAYDLFQGKLDAMAALGSCDVVMRGFLPMADNISVIMDKIGGYLK